MGLFGLFHRKKSLIDSGLLSRAADRHTHILFGVDDGIRTSEDSLAALSFMESTGVAEVWCTPHVMEDVPNTTECLKTRFGELQALYKGPLRLRLAAEYMLDTVFVERLASRDLLTMEDDVLLVETSTMAPPYDFDGMLADVMSAGYRPLLAHPERYRFLAEKDYGRLHADGVLFQLNLGSLVGYYGGEIRKKAEMILKNGWYQAFGSDCHRLKSIKEQYSRPELSGQTVKMLAGIGL